MNGEEQHWFKRAHVGTFLGLANIYRSTVKLANEDQKTRVLLQAKGDYHIMTSPREDAQDHDILIPLNVVLYIIVNSRKGKGKTLKKHILQANIDLKNQIQAIQHENVAFQAQRDVYQNQLQRYEDTIAYLRKLYVDCARDPGKDNIIIIVQKHTTPPNDKYHDLPY